LTAERALVVGLGITGEAVARQLLRHRWDVTVVDDRGGPDARSRAIDLGVELVVGPSAADFEKLVANVDVVCPGPGVPAAHTVHAVCAALGKPEWTELELAARWDERPVVAITGTNGKTTVTAMVTQMLVQSGRRAVTAGNDATPLVDALDDGGAAELFVVEASSFRLQYIETFRPIVGTWLNFAEDHLDWHPDMAHYAAAKARIWENQRGGDVAVANAEDDEVMRRARGVASRLVTFGLARGDFHVARDHVVAADGVPIAAIGELARPLPHDVANLLAAAATAIAAGATIDACAHVARSFQGLPHRMQLVGDSGGVRFYDDSKATTPASVLAALAGLPSVVLIAGGRNKGLDLGVLRAAGHHLRAVVAIGEAAGAVDAALSSVATVTRAASMDEAVEVSIALARPGDAVLLSPGCASYDWYGSYAERGDDFARAVTAAVGGQGR
jgi:UDP-N-acetylmuramoylalanine--D-glutamate ligase